MQNISCFQLTKIQKYNQISQIAVGYTKQKIVFDDG